MKRLLLIAIALLTLLNTHAQEEKSSEKKNKIIPFVLERVKFYGYGQIGYNYSDADELKSSNTFDMKRIILMADAQIIKNLNAFFMFDFANSPKLHEFWGEYKIDDALKFRVGQFKVPFTIESLLSPSKVEIINAAQSVQYLAGINGSDPLYGGNAGRDLGIMLSGDLVNYNGGKLINYKIGLFNGQGMSTKDLNSNKDFAAMFTLNPFKWAALSGSIYRGQGHAATDSPFNNLLKQGMNYKRNRWSVGTEITTVPVYLRAEYLSGVDGKTDSEGYYATASVHLMPQLDLIASYDFFNKDKTTRDKQTNYIMGLQYNFYTRCRLQLQYTYQDRVEELGNANLLQVQLQLGF